MCCDDRLKSQPVADIPNSCDILGVLTILLALAAPASALAPIERITAQTAAKRLSQCGLGPVRTHYDSDLQEDVLVASSAQAATDDQLACAYKVVGFYYTLKLPPNVQRRFDAMLEAKANVWMTAQARAWLSARGLLDRVPKYQEGVTDDAAFTRQIEDLCGPQARGAFQSKYGFHALSPDWVYKLGWPPKRRDTETLGCLTNATAVAGFKVEIIGNEATAPHK